MTDRWREVYEREYPRLVRALLAIGRDPAAAEDAAQEAFVKAHKAGLDNIEKLPGWLLVVGAREVFRKAKRARRETEIWVSLPPRDDGFDTTAIGYVAPSLAREWSLTKGALGPVFSAGGRYHFTDSLALTMRIGYPTFSLGVSFLF